MKPGRGMTPWNRFFSFMRYVSYYFRLHYARLRDILDYSSILDHGADSGTSVHPKAKKGGEGRTRERNPPRTFLRE